MCLRKLYFLGLNVRLIPMLESEHQLPHFVFA